MEDFNESLIEDSQSYWVKEREMFVQNLNGTSMEEIVAVTTGPALFLFISVFIKFWIFNALNMKIDPKDGGAFLRIIHFFLDFITIVVPIVFYLTIFADVSTFVIVFSVILCILIIVSAVSTINQDVFYWRIPQSKDALLRYNINTDKPICISYFRSFVFLQTAVSILAVDFHVFPRRFAKTENYGVSLMDLGVGLYIMANAVVSKDHSQMKTFKDTLKENLTLLTAGVMRCILMQHIAYQQHVTEYGVHWNFFFTLALVKVLSSLLLKAFRGHSLAGGVILLSLHHLLLSLFLEKYVMSDLPRENWTVANREGLVSLSGYLSLYLIGVSTKKIIFNVEKETKQSTIRSKLRSLGTLIALFAVLFHSLKVLEPTFGVSRRLANLPYVLWITLVCFEYLILGLLFELVSLCFLPFNFKNRLHIYDSLVPELFKSINYNAFLFFLLSNVLTGLVNLSFDVLSLDTSTSLSLLLIYMFITCAVVYILYVCNIQIKF